MKDLFLSILCILFSLLVFAQDQNEHEAMAIKMLEQKDEVKAIDYFNKAAFNYWNKGSTSKAIECFNKVVDLSGKQNNKKSLASVYNNLGLLYSDIEDYINALSSFKKALELYTILRDKQETLSASYNTGMTLQLQNRYSESIEYLNKAELLANENNDLKLLRKVFASLAESHERSNNSTMAFTYYEKYNAVDKKLKEMEMEGVKQQAGMEVAIANQQKEQSDGALKETTQVLRQTEDSLVLANRIAREQEITLELRNSQIREKEAQISYEKRIRDVLTYSISILSIFIILLVYLFLLKIKHNKILKSKNIQIEAQNAEITLQKSKLDRQHKNITDSISYARSIQNTILPLKSVMDQCFHSFIIYNPKDIVSGDFYWFSPCPSGSNAFYIAVVDCTGHGVPGSFMSMIGSRLLSEIIIINKVQSPAAILQQLSLTLSKALKQETTDNNDGMDVCLCRVEKLEDAYHVVFSGAKRPLYFYLQASRHFDIVEGDSCSIGGRSALKSKVAFTDQQLEMQSGDMLILSTDGMIDQNGPDRKRFGTPKFTDLLKKFADQPIEEIGDSLWKEYSLFVKREEQRDDITVMGIKLM